MTDARTIGIIGGGQLGRMLAMAAARLNFRTVILEPQADCPAAQVANEQITAAYDDPAALAELADRLRRRHLRIRERAGRGRRDAAALPVPVYPPPKALEVAQDRLVEKRFLNGCGIETARFHAVDSQADLEAALDRFRWQGRPEDPPPRLRRQGPAGFPLGQPTAPDGAFAALGGVPLILESFVPFEREVSIIAARATDGTIVCFDPAENVHRNGILHTSTVPAAISDATAAAARRCGRRRSWLRSTMSASSAWNSSCMADGSADRQRNGPARPQFRPLDGSRLRRLAVRAAYPRRRRPAAGQCRTAIPTA